MTVKCTGAEYAAFMESTDPKVWPEGSWCEDEVVTIDGAIHNFEDPITDAAAVTITGGVVRMSESDDDGPSVESHFRRWRKAQSHTTLSVQVPNEYVADVEAEIEKLRLGGIKLKVLKR